MPKCSHENFQLLQVKKNLYVAWASFRINAFCSTCTGYFLILVTTHTYGTDRVSILCNVDYALTSFEEHRPHLYPYLYSCIFEKALRRPWYLHIRRAAGLVHHFHPYPIQWNTDSNPMQTQELLILCSTHLNRQRYVRYRRRQVRQRLDYDCCVLDNTRDLGSTVDRPR